MSKKSPYKSPVKAGKSKAKQLSTAKKLSPTRKSIGSGKSATKEEKMKARARAKEWAESRKKKSLSPARVDTSEIIVIDDDDDEDADSTAAVCFNENEEKTTSCKNACKSPSCAKCDTLVEKLGDLFSKKTVASGAPLDGSNEEEDTFYDAVEFLPAQRKDPVAVEDVSDEEDEEIRDLNSALRNRAPSRGQWMEPLGREPDGISYSTFSPKQDP